MKRISLHLLLWTAYIAVEFVANLPHYRDKRELLQQTIFFLPVIALPFYFIAYFLVSRLLWRGKKMLFWLSSIIVFLLVMILRLQWENLYWHLQMGHEFRMPLSKISKNLFRDYAVIALGVCLKIIRDWDKKDRLTIQLTEEKRDAELQFLRAQIHPHFLFNTLNNLYGLALKKSPHTPDSILKLSGLLDFILYECNAEKIPLRKEIELIRHYIELERLRFGERLALTFKPKIPQDDLLIAPLLLLPFVENSFKHGAANTVSDTVFVKIDLYVEGKTLHFQVENSKSNRPDNGLENGLKGISCATAQEMLLPYIAMRKISLLFILSLLASVSFSQKHDNWWISTLPGLDTTGNNPLEAPYPATYINFNTSPPTMTYVSCPFLDGDMKVTMSDQEGNVLFHSNGYSIFHLDGTVMANGDSLSQVTFPASYPFGPPMPMAMMSLPRSGHEEDYYILYLEGGPDWYERRRLMLNLVTGATGPQTGSVAFKNKPLFADGHWLEFFQAAKHANGRDWWVVLSDADSVTHERTFYSFFLGADTAYLANTQFIEGYESVPPVWKNWTWQRVFTPDGKYLITLDLFNGVRIHPFDRCTGILSPLTTLPFQLDDWAGGGISVSPNSRFLYVATSHKVFQYDLTDGDIASTVDTIAIYDGFIDPFLGTGVQTLFNRFIPAPDGKLYIPSGFFLHYIAKPNKKGIACSFVQHGLKMPIPMGGLPYYPNYRLGPLDGSACDTLGLNNEPLADFWWFADSMLTVEFEDNSSYEPAEWHWDFGDGGVSQDTSPVHAFPAAGVYNVCLRVSNQYAADTVCKQVAVGVVGVQEVPELPQVQVSPNPFGQWLRIETEGGEALQFRLYDHLGRRVAGAEMPSGVGEIGTAQLPPGVYFWEALSEARFIRTGKLIKAPN